VEQPTPILRRSKRVRKLVERYSPPDFHSTFVLTTTNDVPKSVREVVDSAERKLWKDAMVEEKESLQKNETLDRGLQDTCVYNQRKCKWNKGNHTRILDYSFQEYTYFIQLYTISNILMHHHNNRVKNTTSITHNNNIYVIHPLPRATSTELCFIIY
jgi:hypothetical protein